jgi:hypothetical protein
MMSQILGKVVRGLNLVVYADSGEVFAGFERTKVIAFGNAVSWVKCALFSVASAIVPVICAVIGLSRDNCAHFYRIEYLSPHNTFA